MAIPITHPGEGSHSARTLLLTLLGEAVVPLGRNVWQEVLVNGLQVLGVSMPAARQVVARAARDGWLSAERVGRRSLMTVSDSTWATLQDGRARTIEFGAPQDWDGSWLLVSLTVPEAHRELRYQLRTELAWLGFGSLGNGVWISPHARNEAATVRVLQSGEGMNDAYVFVTNTPVTHEPRELARTAWDLDALLDRYAAFHNRFGSARPDTPKAIFAQWIELWTSWRHFPLFDPELPDTLLPTNWPRQRSYELFHRLDREWSEPALDYFRTLESPPSGTQLGAHAGTGR